MFFNILGGVICPVAGLPSMCEQKLDSSSNLSSAYRNCCRANTVLVHRNQIFFFHLSWRKALHLPGVSLCQITRLAITSDHSDAERMPQTTDRLTSCGWF